MPLGAAPMEVLSMHPETPASAVRAARGHLCFAIKTLPRLCMAKKSWKLGPWQPPNLEAPRGAVLCPKVSQFLRQTGDVTELAAQGERDDKQ